MLLEALAYGAIPVILADEYILPFSEVLDWQHFAVHWPYSRASSLVPYLRTFSPRQVWPAAISHHLPPSPAIARQAPSPAISRHLPPSPAISPRQVCEMRRSARAAWEQHFATEAKQVDTLLSVLDFQLMIRGGSGTEVGASGGASL